MDKTRTPLVKWFTAIYFMAEDKHGMLSSVTPSAAFAETHRKTRNVFRDNYVLEFLDVEEPIAEKDLRKSIIRHLKDFILEIGKNFTFVGEEYRVQVGNHDYFLDYCFSTGVYPVW